MVARSFTTLAIATLALGVWACGGSLAQPDADGDGDADADADADGGGGPCDGVTCSDHGSCIVDGDRAWCVCHDGYHAEGLSCVSDAGPDAGEDGCVPGGDLCNGLDDDCDPATPDGAHDPEVGVPCDGDDADLCAEGLTSCTSAGIVCDDDSDDSTETCNGVDDDCDGTIDTGAECPCHMASFGGHAYLFCSTLQSWDAARAACADVGYQLVTIDSEEENTFLHDTRLPLGLDRCWLGLNDQAEEGTFVWDSTGLPPDYTNWDTGEPNDYMEGEDCAEMRALGGWNDESCARAKAFLCEAE